MEKKAKNEKYSLEMHDQRFNTEEKCIKYLEELRWENGVPTCPKCQNQFMNYYLPSNSRYKCSKCKYQFNIKSESVFHNSKLSLTKWFRAIYFMMTCKRGVSSCKLADHLGVEVKTAWFIQMRLREAFNQDNEEILRGIVQIDETYVGPNPGKDTRLAKRKRLHEKEQDEKYGFSKNRKTKIRKKLQKLDDNGEQLKAFNEEQLKLSKNGERQPFNPSNAILGMYENGGNLIMIHLGKQYLDTTNENIVPHLKKHIDFDSIIVTDQSSFYTEIGKKYADHQTVVHERQFVNEKGFHTNNLENVWVHLKKMILGEFFHLSYGHFHRYLNEFVYRWNIRNISIREKCNQFFPMVFGKKATLREIILNQKKAA